MENANEKGSRKTPPIATEIADNTKPEDSRIVGPSTARLAART